jgi:peptide/nickel transport system permease protein
LNRSRILIKKIRWSLFTIPFVILLNFFLFRILPGVPARAGDKDPRFKQESIQAIRERFGLDKPVYTRAGTIQIMFTIVFVANVLG